MHIGHDHSFGGGEREGRRRGEIKLTSGRKLIFINMIIPILLHTMRLVVYLTIVTYYW